MCRYKYSEFLRSTLETTIVRRQQLIDLASSLPPSTTLYPLSHLSVSLPLNGISLPSSSSTNELITYKAASNNATIPDRTKRRYIRELTAARAEAGVSGDLSDDENYPGKLNFSSQLHLSHLNLFAFL